MLFTWLSWAVPHAVDLLCKQAWTMARSVCICKGACRKLHSMQPCFTRSFSNDHETCSKCFIRPSIKLWNLPDQRSRIVLEDTSDSNKLSHFLGTQHSHSRPVSHECLQRPLIQICRKQYDWLRTRYTQKDFTEFSLYRLYDIVLYHKYFWKVCYTANTAVEASHQGAAPRQERPPNPLPRPHPASGDILAQ